MPASTIGQGILEGLDFADRRKQRKRQQELQNLQLMQTRLGIDQTRTQSLFQDAVTARSLLNANQQSAINFMDDRIDAIAGLGGDPRDTIEIRNLVANGQVDQAKSLLDSTIDAGQQLGLINRADAGQKQFAKSTSAPKVDPETGQIFFTVFDPNTNQAVRIDVPGATAETPEEARAGEVSTKTQQNLFKQATEASKNAFEQLPKIRKSITNINNALKFVDEGANTGPIAKLLPSVTESSVNLQNVAGQMGLDVVGATTFGALSESELAFAIDTALPTGLEGSALKKWLTDKRDAQSKLAKELRKMAIFLGKGDKTIADYLERDDVNFVPAGSQQTQQQNDLSTVSDDDLLRF